jgi:hypothetical protein
MSVFKPFLTTDTVISPFEVNKSFTFKGDSELTSSNVNIDRYIGENITSQYWVSGSNPTGQINIQDKTLIYHSIKELYYSNYLTNPSGSLVGTASFNDDGTITGPVYTPNYYNYLSTTLPTYRYIPTGSGEIIGVISIPSNLFGEYLKPKSVTLTSGSITLQDDGLGNILYNSLKVGDVIYEHGLIILTSDGIPGQDGYGYIIYGTGSYGVSDEAFINNFITTPNLTCSFESTITIYESQYKCTLRQNEFNFSQNPTLLSGSYDSGVLYDFATGSFFSPYVTTVGLYNNNKELIAVAKLAQPLPISTITDTTILVNLDL